MNTIYKKAGQEAGKELDDKMANEIRRSSDSDLKSGNGKSSPEIDISGSSKMSLEIRKRIKEFQKKHLLAAHDALWGVLGDMKARGEVKLFLLKIKINYFDHTMYSKSQIFVQKFNFDKTPTFSRVFHQKKF